MSKPLILVTGSTGTVGSEVVKALAEAGHNVRALVRDPAKAAFDEHFDFNFKSQFFALQKILPLLVEGASV